MRQGRSRSYFSSFGKIFERQNRDAGRGRS
jgi:hypothetical protein